MKKAGIIIVNYKDYAEKYLSDCVQSLRQQTWSGEQTLFIIDNDSSFESRQEISKHAPNSIVLPRSDGNYSAANKLGIEHAMQADCDYLVIANMDVIFAKNWLAELIVALDGDENIGVAQSKIMLWPKNQHINSVGNVIHFLGFGFTQGYGEKDNGQYDKVNLIGGYASGCSLAIKRDVIKTIGNYDETYYMYHDDLEMSWRAKLAGYKIIFAPNSIVYHKYEFSRSVRMLYYMERNRYLAIFSFYKIPTILLILPALILFEMGMIAYAIFKGWLVIKLQVYVYFFKFQSWTHIVRTRKQIKKYRHIKDKDVVKNFAGKIEFQEIMNPLLKYAVNPIFNLYWRLVRLLIFW